MLLLIIIYLAFISLGLPDPLLGAAWPLMHTALGVPLENAGIISLIVSSGTVFSSLASARLVRRFGTGLVTAVSVALTAAALLGFSFARHFALLCVCALPLGVGGGSVDAALNNYVALHYKARHMNWLHSFWGVGTSLGPLIMAHFLSANGAASWTAGYRTISILQWGLVAVLFFALPLWKRENVTAETAIRAPNNRNLVRLPGVKNVLAAFFAYCALESATGLWAASFLVMEKGIEAATAARWAASFYIGITAGRVAAGFVAHKIPDRRMVRLGTGIVAAGIVFLFIAPTGAALLASLFVVGLGCAPLYPALIHETPANFGRENSQAVIGLQMAAAYIGVTTMPALFGAFAARFGFRLFPVVLAFFLAVFIIMTETVNTKGSTDLCHRA